MKNNVQNNGFKIGLIFTIASFLLTLTIVVPIFSIMPGVIFEQISQSLISNKPYSNVGKLTVLIVSFIAIIFVLTSVFYVRKKTLSNQVIAEGRMVLMMAIFYFIVHPLGMYLYWWIKLDFASDGQLIFIVFLTFPLTSLTFFLFGLLLDYVRNKAANKRVAELGLKC